MKSFLFFLLASITIFATEPNPPTWPDNVIILKTDDPHAQEKVDQAFSTNGGHATQAGEQPPGEFSNQRYAILFEPGIHTLNVNVGFYTSIIGLGYAPKDTTISTVTCENGNFC